MKRTSSFKHSHLLSPLFYFHHQNKMYLKVRFYSYCILVTIWRRTVIKMVRMTLLQDVYLVLFFVNNCNVVVVVMINDVFLKVSFILYIYICIQVTVCKVYVQQADEICSWKVSNVQTDGRRESGELVHTDNAGSLNLWFNEILFMLS